MPNESGLYFVLWVYYRVGLLLRMVTFSMQDLRRPASFKYKICVLLTPLLIPLNTWEGQTKSLLFNDPGVLLAGIAMKGLFCCRLSRARRWGIHHFESALSPSSSRLWMCPQGGKDWYVTIRKQYTFKHSSQLKKKCSYRCISTAI